MPLPDLSQFRMVDLSMQVRPGQTDRRLRIAEVERFAWDGSFQYIIETTTHLGTHIEVPAHYDEAGPFTDEIPLRHFWGRLVVLRFGIESVGRVVPLELYQQAVEGRDVNDAVVVCWAPQGPLEEGSSQRTFIGAEIVGDLVDRGIKMFGFGGGASIDSSRDEAQAVHRLLFGRGIPMLEYVQNLESLTSSEAIIFALPLPIAGLDASPVRAVALEDASGVDT